MTLAAITPIVDAVVIGGSAGASVPLRTLLGGLTPAFPASILVVMHMHPDDGGLLAENLGQVLRLPVVEALDKMPVRRGRVHLAPADYHLLAERDGKLALSVDERVWWSRPSIDVTFKSAAAVWGRRLMAILLSGANEDGAAGLAEVQRRGGLALCQDPATATMPTMPAAGIKAAALRGGESPEALARRLMHLESATPDAR
jgi:two-component system chemotaxis response regulator CheB